MVREDYRIPFLEIPLLAKDPIFFDSYSPASIRRITLSEEIDSLSEKQAVKLDSPSPGITAVCPMCRRPPESGV